SLVTAVGMRVLPLPGKCDRPSGCPLFDAEPNLLSSNSWTSSGHLGPSLALPGLNVARTRQDLIVSISIFDIAGRSWPGRWSMYRYGPHIGLGTILIIALLVWLLFFHH